jgi:uncharacterized membrane protein
MATKVEKSITVDVPVNTAYSQWTQFEEFPEFRAAFSGSSSSTTPGCTGWLRSVV